MIPQGLQGTKRRRHGTLPNKGLTYRDNKNQFLNNKCAEPGYIEIPLCLLLAGMEDIYVDFNLFYFLC